MEAKGHGGFEAAQAAGSDRDATRMNGQAASPAGPGPGSQHVRSLNDPIRPLKILTAGGRSDLGVNIQANMLPLLGGFSFHMRLSRGGITRLACTSIHFTIQICGLCCWRQCLTKASVFQCTSPTRAGYSFHVCFFCCIARAVRRATACTYVGNRPRLLKGRG